MENDHFSTKKHHTCMECGLKTINHLFMSLNLEEIKEKGRNPRKLGLSEGKRGKRAAFRRWQGMGIVQRGLLACGESGVGGTCRNSDSRAST